MFEIQGKYTSAKIMIDEIESLCLSQIYNMINNPVFTNPVVIMPDTHAGKGSVIGFTMLVSDKIIPNVVGVDLGCGMLSINLGNIDLNKNELEDKIRKEISFGKNINERVLFYKFKSISHLCDKVGISEDYAQKSLGTVGGGNHFIEFGKDLNDNIWLTIHSGSRNLGKKVCEYWQKIAVKRKNEKRLLNTNLESIETIKAKYQKNEWEFRIKERNSKLKDNSISDGLEYLEGNDYSEYLNDMQLCQSYARQNRLTIFYKLRDIFKFSNTELIHTIHNFISFDDMIIRKGAIRSYEGELCVIPLNMRDGILICEGKSNPEWNFSAPHGAGRIMSRSEAKRFLILGDFKEDMKDRMSSSVCQSAIDESPRAYKNSKLIEECIEPTVKIINRIIPIITFKDISENGED